MVGWSRLGKIMGITLKDRSWTSFVWASLTMWLMVVCVLIFARTQLHEEVIASDGRFLKSIFEKNLEEFYLQNLESEFLFADNELSTNDLSGLETLLNQAAISSLNIPQIQGIEAYNQKYEAFDLSTSVTNAYPQTKEFEKAISKGWSYRNIKSNTLSLLTPIRHEGVEICIEFTLLPNSYEKSWKEIDAALIKQGLLIGLTMLVILWVIFKIMIGRIFVKEKLLLERTEVLKKTNEELSTEEHRVASCLMLYTFIYELLNFICRVRYIDFSNWETSVENISLIRRKTSHLTGDDNYEAMMEPVEGACNEGQVYLKDEVDEHGPTK